MLMSFVIALQASKDLFKKTTVRSLQSIKKEAEFPGGSPAHVQ